MAEDAATRRAREVAAQARDRHRTEAALKEAQARDARVREIARKSPRP